MHWSKLIILQHKLRSSALRYFSESNCNSFLNESSSELTWPFPSLAGTSATIVKKFPKEKKRSRSTMKRQERGWQFTPKTSWRTTTQKKSWAPRPRKTKKHWKATTMLWYNRRCENYTQRCNRCENYTQPMRTSNRKAKSFMRLNRKLELRI